MQRKGGETERRTRAASAPAPGRRKPPRRGLRLRRAPLAGGLTLAFSSIGFLGKLLAEEIEALDAGQIEAVRATGASWPQVVAYGVLPQMMPRLVGLSAYRLDINFRESAVIGVVGAGG